MTIHLMEPMMPVDGNKELEDLAFDLTAKATAIQNQVKPYIVDSIGTLVRSMNCYYSNLIEDHNTHPFDIDRALKGDYSTNPEKRELQLEAKAHIEVQKLIEETIDTSNIVDKDYIKWVHKEFCDRLPEELLILKDQSRKKNLQLLPGEFRKSDVKVGKHIPPEAGEIDRFLDRFEEVYSPDKLSKIKQIIAVPASHHRFVWIHPFYDGNGRVSRMLSHAYFLKIGIGSAMWSVSRGLSRREEEYKKLLMAADRGRQGDHDGRGNLSARGLLNFCTFFLSSSIDQIDFMSTLLEPKGLLNRIESYIYEEIERGNLLKGSYELIREAYYNKEFERGKAEVITGYSERQARKVLTGLVNKDILISDTPKGPVRLNFPATVVNKWFPKLYPDDVE